MKSVSKNVLLGLVPLLLLLVGFAPAEAQIPDEFKNLKVLPKDISKRELVDIMRNFSGALGVRCKFCHVGEDPNSLEGYDFASDEPEHKKIAREMMKMAGKINNELMPAVGLEHPTRVRCVTCHRGLENPQTLDKILLGVVDKDGVDAAIAKYRELRDEHYGSGAYDFSAATLNDVVETLAQDKQDVDGAIAVARLNVEYNPDAAYAQLMLGRLYSAKGDKQAAIAAVERSLELEPDNKWAKGLLQQLKSSE